MTNDNKSGFENAAGPSSLLQILLGALGGVVVTSVLAWILLLEVQNAILSANNGVEMAVLRPANNAAEAVSPLEPDFSGYEVRELEAAVEGEASVFSLWNQGQPVSADLNSLLKPFFKNQGAGWQGELLARDAQAGQLYLTMTETDGPGAFFQVLRFKVANQAVTPLPNISAALENSDYQVLADNAHLLSWGGDSLGQIFMNNLATDESQLFYTAPAGTTLVSALRPNGLGFGYEFDVVLSGNYVEIGLYDSTKDSRGEEIKLDINDERDFSWIADEDFGQAEFYPQFVKRVALPLGLTN